MLPFCMEKEKFTQRISDYKEDLDKIESARAHLSENSRDLDEHIFEIHKKFAKYFQKHEFQGRSWKFIKNFVGSYVLILAEEDPYEARIPIEFFEDFDGAIAKHEEDSKARKEIQSKREEVEERELLKKLKAKYEEN